MAKILMAKVGTDAHDMGVTVVARWLREAGHEVVYAGLYNTPERVVQIAARERPDLIGLSFLGGEPVYLSGRVMDCLREKGLGGTALVVGGVITPVMAAGLKELGVGAMFTPGTGREAILAGIAQALGQPADPPPADPAHP